MSIVIEYFCSKRVWCMRLQFVLFSLESWFGANILVPVHVCCLRHLNNKYKQLERSLHVQCIKPKEKNNTNGCCQLVVWAAISVVSQRLLWQHQRLQTALWSHLWMNLTQCSCTLLQINTMQNHWEVIPTGLCNVLLSLAVANGEKTELKIIDGQ